MQKTQPPQKQPDPPKKVPSIKPVSVHEYDNYEESFGHDEEEENGDFY